MIKKYLLSIVFYMLAALGISLTIKAAIGVSSFNSINVALSAVSGIKVGTVTTVLNLMFLGICLLIDTKKNWKEYFLIFVSLICFGSVINFIYYTLLMPFEINNYFLRLLLFVLGTVIAGFGTGRALHYGILKFPIEKCCQLLEKRTKKTFSFYRYSVDIVSVILSISVSLVFGLELFVREGTLISLLLLSYVIGKSKDMTFIHFQSKRFDLEDTIGFDKD